MFILRNVLKSNKSLLSKSLFSGKSHKALVHNPLNTFFWNSKKEEQTEAMKKFNDLNQEYKTLRDTKKFMVNTEKPKAFISEEDKKKQLNAIQTAFRDYIDTYKFDASFNEMKFIQLLSTLSYTYDNSSIIKDPKFIKLTTDVAQEMNSFKEKRTLLLFLSFCSHHAVENPAVWESFNSIFKNKAGSFSFEEKLEILANLNESNQAELEEFFTQFENDFIAGFKDQQGGYNFLRIFKVLTLYRNFHQGSDNFFFTIEEIIKPHIADMNIEDLTLFLMHYVTNPLENEISRHEIISKIETRLSQSHVFLNNAQLLGVLYAFIKYGKASEIFLELMEKRTLMLLDKFTVEQLKKLIVLYANLPKYSRSIFVAIEKHAIDNLKRIPRSFISTLFQTFTEMGYHSERFFKNADDILTKNVYNMENEELGKNLWAFSMKGKVEDTSFFAKAAECIKSKVQSYSAKELSTFIWSFSYAGYKDKELYDQVEETIYENLQKSGYTIRDITLLLWAYIQKVPLRPPTVDLMKEECVRLKGEAEAWDVAIILWGFSKFDPYPVQDFFVELQDVCTELIPEMTNYELSISLRGYAETNVGNEALYKTFEEKVLEVLETLDYNEVISCVYSFSIITCVDNAAFKEVIEKLKERAKHLQHQVQVADQERKMKGKLEIDLSSVEEYLKNEAIEKLQNQGK